MNIIAQVIVLCVTAQAAFASPGFIIGNDIAYQSQSDTQLSKSNQDPCYTNYGNSLDSINSWTVNETEKCYELAKNNSYDKFADETVAELNVVSKNLQKTLNDCSKQNSSKAVLECYVDKFDLNLEYLHYLTAHAQSELTAISSYEYAVIVQRDGCIREVVIGSKTNSTAASNDLQTCLSGGISDRPTPKSEVAENLLSLE